MTPFVAGKGGPNIHEAITYAKAMPETTVEHLTLNIIVFDAPRENTFKK